jgi:hypothetical protein
VTPQERQLADQLFSNGGQPQQQQPSIGAIEAATEGVQIFVKHNFPGLSLDKIVGDIGHELKHQFDMGRHELAAALFNGSAFVMYPRGTREDHGVHGPQQGPAEQSQAQPPEPGQQLERGGREM